MLINKPTLVILAAGMGSRYGGLKQIDPVGPNNELIIEYSIFDARRSGFGKVVCVIREEILDDCKRILQGCINAGVNVEFAFQRLSDIPSGFAVPASRVKQWGTAHAVFACRHNVAGPFAVINADDFYGLESYKVLASFLSSVSASQPLFSLVAFELNRTLSDHGGVSRGLCELDKAGMLTRIKECHGVERYNCGARYMDDGKSVVLTGDTPISMNMWGFTPTFFRLVERELIDFLRSHGDSERSECYIPSAVDGLLRRQEATVKCLRSREQWYGVTHPQDKPAVARGIELLVQKGQYPSPLWK